MSKITMNGPLNVVVVISVFDALTSMSTNKAMLFECSCGAFNHQFIIDLYHDLEAETDCFEMSSVAHAYLTDWLESSVFPGREIAEEANSPWPELLDFCLNVGDVAYAESLRVLHQHKTLEAV